MKNEETNKAARKIVESLTEKGCTLATAESCTGGAIAAAITAIPGSSAMFKGGIVAYSNEVKTNVLGVNEETLAAHGAVSEETVLQMAQGARKLLKTDYAVATSGIAGPGGGTPEKPVGTVWMALAAGNRTKAYCLHQSDQGRNKNIELAVLHALNLLLQEIECCENAQ